jgi:hypothetical protein
MIFVTYLTNAMIITNTPIINRYQAKGKKVFVCTWRSRNPILARTEISVSSEIYQLRYNHARQKNKTGKVINQPGHCNLLYPGPDQ